VREVARVLLGGTKLAAARNRGITFSGDRKVLRRLRTTRLSG
jgi:hypothetical protein